MTTEKSPPSLTSLFLLFLKIGAISFGGNVALVATIREQAVVRRKWMDDSVLLDGTMLSSVLPGPLATNVTAFIGYRLRGYTGALVCLGAVLLPSFVLLCAFSWFYFIYGELEWVANIFRGILPGVVAVILSAAIDLARRNVKKGLQWLIVAAATALMVFFGNLWMTFAVMMGSGLAGFLLFREKAEQPAVEKEPTSTAGLLKEMAPYFYVLTGIIAVLVLTAVFASPVLRATLVQLGVLAATFGGMSVTLFGGGYVFIPAMQHTVVDVLQWVSFREFSDGIAIGQVTPGPIMISAAFIGWKVKGFWGALVSTVAIFLPPATLTVFASHFIERIRKNPSVDAIFKGMRPGVIGLIFAAVIIFGKTVCKTWPVKAVFGMNIPFEWPALAIFAAILALALFVKKIDQALLIPIAGLLGWLLYLA